MIASLPDVINNKNKNTVANTLAMIKLTAGTLKQKCMLALGDAANFELALNAMLKDAQSVKIKSASTVIGTPSAKSANAFLDFVARMCKAFAFSDTNFYVTVNFNTSVCQILTDKRKKPYTFRGKGGK